MHESLESEQLPVQSLRNLYARDWQNRGKILKLLSMMSNHLPVDLLIQILSETYDPGFERERLVQVFTLIQDESVLERVLETASERYWFTRSIAAQVLGMLKHDVPIDLLLHSLRTDCPRVSEAASDALERVADQVPREDMLALLQDSHPWIRSYALELWENRTDIPPLEALLTVLHDESEEVRVAAANLCKERDTGISLSVLLEVAEDVSMHVSALAIQALEIWGQRDPEVAFTGIVHLLILMEQQPERYSAYYEALPEAISSLGPLVSEEMLLQAFFDVGGDHQIAQVLGKLGTPASIDRLLAALDTPSEQLRGAAVKALGLTDSPQPVPALLTLLQELAEDPYA